MTSVNESGHGAPITELSHVQLLVSDVGESARWYAAALGLVPFTEDLDIGYVALQHSAAKIVVVLTHGANAGDRSPGSVDPVLDHLAFAVPDGDSLDAWASHLTETGIDHAGVVLENGHSSLPLRDPDGTAIELVAP
ncbi:MAG: VOC family protein [Acidimicrobiales bacterium]